MKEIISPNVKLIFPFKFKLPKKYQIKCFDKGVFVLEPLKPKTKILSEIKKVFSNYFNEIYDVDVTGIKSEENNVGSQRFCTMNEEFAKSLTEIIKNKSIVDLIQSNNENYEMVEVSKYFRFMRYKTGGEHYPHWDSDFTCEAYDKNIFTKYSLVFYFNECNSGEIVFIDSSKTEFEKEKSDWNRQVTDSEITLKIKPDFCKIVIFPHELCHSVLPFTDVNNERYICRGDILFKKL